jgi:hypothetical protein
VRVGARGARAMRARASGAGRTVVQRVVGVGLVKEVDDLRAGRSGGRQAGRQAGTQARGGERARRRPATHAVDDRVDVKDGLPVFAQNVQADVALEVNVRVVDLRERRTSCEGAGEGGTAPRGGRGAAGDQPARHCEKRRAPLSGT